MPVCSIFNQILLLTYCLKQHTQHKHLDAAIFPHSSAQALLGSIEAVSEWQFKVLPDIPDRTEV